MRQENSKGDASQITNWDALSRRLEIARRNLEQATESRLGQKQAILKARAKLLARELLSPETETPQLEVVEFRLAHENYGVESRYIREVYPLKELHPLPCTPPFVLGLANVRGQLLSIVDLKKFFDLPATGLASYSQAIILHHGTMEFGILADAVLDVRHFVRQTLQPSLPTLTGIREEFLFGITPERAIILDAEKLLSSPDMIVYEEVET
jgi:purine-binding chemotaxis protein CheW